MFTNSDSELSFQLCHTYKYTAALNCITIGKKKISGGVFNYYLNLSQAIDFPEMVLTKNFNLQSGLNMDSEACTEKVPKSYTKMVSDYTLNLYD